MEQNQPQLQSDSRVSAAVSPAATGAKPENPAPPPPRSFFRWFLIGMFSFYLLFGSSVLAVWLALRPRVPVFELDRASVSNLTIHNSTARSYNISGTWELGFQIRNHNNKIRISYDNITSSISYRDVLLARAPIPLPPFDQANRNRTSIAASFSGSEPIAEFRVVGLNRKRSKGSLYLDAKITANVTFRLGGWRPRRRSLTVECEDVFFDIPANATSGKMVDGPMMCSVEF